MKFTAALLASFAATATGAKTMDLDDQSVPLAVRFQSFTEQFDKVYVTDAARKAAFRAFAQNDAKIVDVNAQNLTYTLGHNEWSDMTEKEFNAKMLGGFVPKAESEKNIDLTLTAADRLQAAPDAKDWVELGAVTPIKNQGQCGSCWAFSAVMGMEGDMFVENNKLVPLSEQFLVSCDDKSSDQGCEGGLMDNAFNFVINSTGIPTEADYPYTSGTGTTGLCVDGKAPAVTIKNFTDVPANDEDALLVAVTQQPVSVAIEADKARFQLYKSGVFTDVLNLCGHQLDHGVGIVGFGTEVGLPYWKVKNSWGESWGMEGYILMERNKDTCGIAQQPSFPQGAAAAQ